MMDSDVLIVGAGPTGLTLAIDLGKRGVRCTLIEQKGAPAFLPKMERINARTMEIYRRMGLAQKIRAAGLAARLSDGRLCHPGADRAAAAASALSVGCASASTDAREPMTARMPLEPYQLISQYTLEPLLKSIAETSAGHRRCGSAANSCRCGRMPQGVTAQVRTSRRRRTRSCAPLIWSAATAARARCARNSASSSSGEGNLLALRQALFRCDELFDRLPLGNGPGKGRHYHVADDKATFLIMQDSTKHWTLHSIVDSDEEMKSPFERTVGVPVKYEMLSCAPWRQNLLLADRYGKGRVFLAGDAVHLVIPTGGLGMNSGVGDAIDLSWKLAATLDGWGGPELAQILRDRAPPDRRPQCRRLALRDDRAAQMARHVAAEYPRELAGGG